MTKILLVPAAVALMLPAAAFAAPVLSVSATDNGVPLVFVPSVNVPGDLTGSFIDANFAQITVDLTGVPAVPSPDLGTVTLQVSGSVGGTHVIDLVATQTGLTQPAGFNGQVTQTFNNLIPPTNPGGPVTEDFSINGVVINSHLFPALPARADTATFNDPGLPAITSNAQEFVATFTGASQALELTQEFVAAATIPEPASLAMLATGLLGMGLIARRRNRR